MAIKAIVKKLEDVPEQYHDLYVERNGQFELSVEIEGLDGAKTFTDYSKLNEALRKERNDHKATKTKFEILGDRKPEEVVALLDRIPELEAAAEGKVDDNKINELVEKRIGSKLGPVQRELTQLKQTNTALMEENNGFKTEKRTRTIHDAVREAIGKTQGFQTAAVEDALIFAERMLDISEDGKVLTKDQVGVTPGVDPTVWLTDMQQRKPHWWGGTAGGGSGGNRGNGTGGGANPWSAESWNMTEQGTLYKQNPARAQSLAKAAGTTIGGPKPAPRK